MNPEEAITIIRNLTSAFVACVEVVNTFTETDYAPLFFRGECLKRKGLCAASAAI